MKQPKKYTNQQLIAALSKENGKTFSLLMQLAQEVQGIGSMTQTMLAVIKEMPGYEKAVEKLKTANDVSDSTQEESKSALKDVDEDAERLRVIGQNGNTGEHYDSEDLILD